MELNRIIKLQKKRNFFKADFSWDKKKTKKDGVEKKTAKAPDKIELFFQELNWPFVQQLRKKRKPEVNQKKKKKS